LVTVVGVRVTNDLSSAKVLFSVMGDETARAETLKGLKAATPFLRRLLVRHMDVKVSPELRWVYDDSLDRSFRIEQMLRNEAAPPKDEPAPPEKDGET
jgi:ribosome-binding factor A